MIYKLRTERKANFRHPERTHGRDVEIWYRGEIRLPAIFVGDRYAPIPRPIKELKGFKRVSLNPGETKNVVVKLDRRAFSYYDVKRQSWIVAPGDFDLFVARSAADIALTGKVALH